VRDSLRVALMVRSAILAPLRRLGRCSKSYHLSGRHAWRDVSIHYGGFQ